MACRCAERRRLFAHELPPGSNERPRQWFVLGARNQSCSAFNGYRPRWSPTSLVACRVCGACWRTRIDVSGLLVSNYFPERSEPRVEPAESI